MGRIIDLRFGDTSLARVAERLADEEGLPLSCSADVKTESPHERLRHVARTLESRDPDADVLLLCESDLVALSILFGLAEEDLRNN